MLRTALPQYSARPIKTYAGTTRSSGDQRAEVVGDLPGVVVVRDSKDPDYGTLAVASPTLRAAGHKRAFIA